MFDILLLQENIVTVKKYSGDCNGGGDEAMILDNAETLNEGDEAEFALNLSESKIYFSKIGGEKKAIFENTETGKDISYLQSFIWQKLVIQ